jgi:hypothetical protein
MLLCGCSSDFVGQCRGDCFLRQPVETIDARRSGADLNVAGSGRRAVFPGRGRAIRHPTPEVHQARPITSPTYPQPTTPILDPSADVTSYTYPGHLRLRGPKNRTRLYSRATWKTFKAIENHSHGGAGSDHRMPV